MVAVSLPNGSKAIKIVQTGVAICLGSLLPNGTFVNRIDIQPLVSNVNPIMVGDYTVGTTQYPNGGVLIQCVGTSPVSPDVYNIELITSLSNIFINGTVGDGVSFNYYYGER